MQIGANLYLQIFIIFTKHFVLLVIDINITYIQTVFV